MDTIPGFRDTDRLTAIPDIILGNFEDLTEILVGESVFLGFFQSLVRGQGAFGFQQFLLFFHQLLHLLDEVMFYVGALEDLFHRSTFA